LSAVLEAEGDPGLAPEGSGDWPHASWTRSQLWSCQRSVTGIRYDFGIFEQYIVEGEQIEKR